MLHIEQSLWQAPCVSCMFCYRSMVYSAMIKFHQNMSILGMQFLLENGLSMVINVRKGYLSHIRLDIKTTQAIPRSTIGSRYHIAPCISSSLSMVYDASGELIHCNPIVFFETFVECYLDWLTNWPTRKGFRTTIGPFSEVPGIWLADFSLPQACTILSLSCVMAWGSWKN